MGIFVRGGAPAAAYQTVLPEFKLDEQKCAYCDIFSPQVKESSAFVFVATDSTYIKTKLAKDQPSGGIDAPIVSSAAIKNDGPWSSSMPWILLTLGGVAVGVTAYELSKNRSKGYEKAVNKAINQLNKAMAGLGVADRAFVAGVTAGLPPGIIPKGADIATARYVLNAVMSAYPEDGKFAIDVDKNELLDVSIKLRGAAAINGRLAFEFRIYADELGGNTEALKKFLKDLEVPEKAASNKDAGSAKDVAFVEPLSGNVQEKLFYAAPEMRAEAMANLINKSAIIYREQLSELVGLKGIAGIDFKELALLGKRQLFYDCLMEIAKMPVDIVNPEKQQQALTQIVTNGGVFLKGFGKYDLDLDSQKRIAGAVGDTLMEEIKVLSAIDFSLIDGSTFFVETGFGEKMTPAAILDRWRSAGTAGSSNIDTVEELPTLWSDDSTAKDAAATVLGKTENAGGIVAGAKAAMKGGAKAKLAGVVDPKTVKDVKDAEKVIRAEVNKGEK